MSVAVAHSSSPAGQAALRAGVAEARLRGTDLVVLRVADGLSHDAGDDESLRAETAAELAGVDVGDLTWTLRVAAEGRDPAGALVDLATEVGAELLVLGSRRRSAVGKLLLGSVVQRVLLDCPLPVLVVKARS